MQSAIRCASTTLHCADARNLAAFVPPNSVHLVVTSPPYNVGVQYGTYDDNLPDAEYLALLADVFAACERVLVEGGRIAVVAPAGVGRNPWRPLAPRVAGLLTEVGFTLRGWIIWDKGSSGGRCTWGSYCLSTNPSLRDTTEIINVAHKERPALAVPAEALARDGRGCRVSRLLDKATFLELSQDHWQVAPECARRVRHPAPFPVRLVERLIRFYAFEGAHVLDPFAGSGTVGVASQRLGCRATLVEVDPGYCELARQRLALEPGLEPMAGPPALDRNESPGDSGHFFCH